MVQVCHDFKNFGVSSTPNAIKHTFTGRLDQNKPWADVAARICTIILSPILLIAGLFGELFKKNAPKVEKPVEPDPPQSPSWIPSIPGFSAGEGSGTGGDVPNKG